MKTTFLTPQTAQRAWRLVDAKDQVLGRLAARLAIILQGKDKPSYTPHVDSGDFVVVVNADRVRLTGRKVQQKTYERYSGYPGGRRVIPYTEMARRKPEEVLRLAVRRMLPKSKLGRAMLKKLKVYAGPEHPHGAQQPVPTEIEQ